MTHSIAPLQFVVVFGEARGTHSLAGWGLVVMAEDGRERLRRNGFMGVSTPPRAQYTAIIEGITVAASEGLTRVLTSHEAPHKQITSPGAPIPHDTADLWANAIEMLGSHNISLDLVTPEETELAAGVAGVAIDSRGRRTAFEAP